MEPISIAKKINEIKKKDISVNLKTNVFMNFL